MHQKKQAEQFCEHRTVFLIQRKFKTSTTTFNTMPQNILLSWKKFSTFNDEIHVRNHRVVHILLTQVDLQQEFLLQVDCFLKGLYHARRLERSMYYLRFTNICNVFSDQLMQTYLPCIYHLCNYAFTIYVTMHIRKEWKIH